MAERPSLTGTRCPRIGPVPHQCPRPAPLPLGFVVHKNTPKPNNRYEGVQWVIAQPALRRPCVRHSSGNSSLSFAAAKGSASQPFSSQTASAHAIITGELPPGHQPVNRDVERNIAKDEDRLLPEK
jgi:hypothetical protein